MKSLLSRLENAPEGSRELDALIEIAISDPDVMTFGGGYGPNAKPATYNKASEIFKDGWEDWDSAARTIGAPFYTTSLDAALTLVPEGWDHLVIKQDPSGTGVEVGNWRLTPEPHLTHHGEGAHFSIPLAIVLAILRARE